MHKEVWKEYYDCLEKAYSEIESEKIMHPIALEALEGTSAMCDKILLIFVSIVLKLLNCIFQIEMRNVHFPNRDIRK